jgi:hypothetical protein
MSFKNPFENSGTGENPETEKPDYPVEEGGLEHGVAFEREKPPELKFYVTDHSADNPDTGDPERLRELYADIKKDGIQSIRYDWRWQRIEPQAGEFNSEQLGRYREARDIMKETGLDEPTIILSNPPEWAVKLYREDREKFFEEYRHYAEEVRNSLGKSSEGRVSRIQIFNELNNKIYTPFETEDIPRLCEITRRTFHDYNPDLKLTATFIAGNFTELSSKIGMAKPMEKFLPELKKIKDSFDVIAVDYYPGLWHLPLKEAGWKMKDVFKQLGALKQVFEEIATWGKEYEIGEVGLPTNQPWGNEKRQRYFYDVFFRAFRRLMLDFQSRGIKLPSSVGLYEAIDEPPRTVLGKVLRKTPFPEHDMGMRLRSGRRKLILQGSPHVLEEERIKKPSQLQRIISYLRRPIKESE